MEEHDKHEFAIIVNSREKTWNSKEISFDQVVALAFDPVPTGDDLVFVITWRRGEGNKQGSLDEGASVKVKNGMIFDVTATNKS